MKSVYALSGPQIVIADRFAQPAGVHLAHASIGGGPTLRDAPWWRDINGVFVGLPRTVVWFTFRRPIRSFRRVHDMRKAQR